MATEVKDEQIKKEVYLPTKDERSAINETLKDMTRGQTVIMKSYNQFNGRNVLDCIDDWQKRWMGFVPQPDAQIDDWQSRVFINFTRNMIISYLVKTALTVPESKIIAVNKKTGTENRRLADLIHDLNQFSLNEENGEARFMEIALETTVKGTGIVYEGYKHQEQELDVPIKYDQATGSIKTKKEKSVIFDNCYQEVIALEDMYISNPYQADIQKQPFLIWKRITTKQEAESEFGHYANFKYIQGGSYTINAEPTTFYRNTLQTELGKDQVEILRYYNRSKNIHRVIINGVVIYDGVIPFKDGKYPFAKYIFEPAGNGSDFFWGLGFPNKIQGEQDLKNMFFNMMVDKSASSLLPFGLTNDDDIIDTTQLKGNRIYKVNDPNAYVFETLPGLSTGDATMFQIINKEISDDSGTTGGQNATTPRGGKLPVRQVLLQHQEAMSKLGFSMNYLEDGERDRTIIRIAHILQFYSIPKIEKITGKNGKEVEKLTYRDVRVSNTKLEDGKDGTRVIKLTGDLNDEARAKMADDLSVTEAMGEESGTPTEAVALNVDTFKDFNLSIQVVKNSSYEKNQVIDQASRQEYANWRLSLAQIAPVDAVELIDWVNEAYDIDSDRFKPKQQSMGQNPLVQPNQPPQGQPTPSPMQPSGTPQGQVTPKQLTATDRVMA